jgi:hypothetical protein
MRHADDPVSFFDVLDDIKGFLPIPPTGPIRTRDVIGPQLTELRNGLQEIFKPFVGFWRKEFKRIRLFVMGKEISDPFHRE